MTTIQTATVGSSVGLHARPASLLVKAATKAARAGVDVTIALPDSEPVDARSLLSVIALGARHGDQVTLTASGDGADEVLAELVGLVEAEED
ncbi:MAG: HPr family phosphocarrier protein [Patulibacter sp.]